MIGRRIVAAMESAHPIVRSPWARMTLVGMNQELSDKGFLVTASDDLIIWARTGSHRRRGPNRTHPDGVAGIFGKPEPVVLVDATAAWARVRDGRAVDSEVTGLGVESSPAVGSARNSNP
jgi:hypothetical protein